MASGTGTEIKCIGCGKEAVVAKRRSLDTPASASVLPSLKELFCRWFEERNVDLEERDLDSMLGKSFLCRPCYCAYEAYSKKQATLMEALNNSLSNLIETDRAHSPSHEPQSPASSSEPSSKRLRLDPVTTQSRSNSKQQPSTSVSITLDYPARTRSYCLSPRRMQYGKTLARSINCAKSLAKHALKDPEAKKWLLIGFGKLLKYEVRNLCSDKANSILKSKSKKNLSNFLWKKVLEECILHCPSLTSLLFNCTKLKANQSHLKLMISMSKNSTYNLISLLGENHDFSVLQWKESLTPSDITDEDPIEIDHLMISTSLLHEDREIENDGSKSIAADSLVSTLLKLSTYLAAFCQGGHTLMILYQQEKLNAYCNNWNGFKIVGDNIDKNIVPRDRRIDKQTSSLHCFHLYAVKDRVDFSGISDKMNPHFMTPIEALPVDVMLPSLSDKQMMLHNFTVLIARILMEEFAFVKKTFSDIIPKHIDHLYSKEMKKKSEVVPLGVVLKNENVPVEMIEILESLEKYVPVLPVTGIDQITNKEVSANKLHSILFGGNQLTRKRAEGVKESRKNSLTPLKQLQGLLPICEDWHAKQIFLEVVWKHLYDTKSLTDKGTLYQLRNAIDRRDISATATGKYNSCDDCFSLVNADDVPSHPLLTTDLWLSDDDKRKDTLQAMLNDFLHHYIDIDITITDMSHENIEDVTDDEVQRYNYSIEALNLLAQYHFWFSARQASQLIWSRYINIHGILRRDIPCDLHLEHLNRICKDTLSNLGSNKTNEALTRSSKCVGELEKAITSFDKELQVTQHLGVHSRASTEKDKKIVVQQLVEAKVFDHISNRKHRQIKTEYSSLFPPFKRDTFIKCRKEHLSDLRSKLKTESIAT
uniref:DUF6589 domain-containing protein n=1 Tax=Amphimedon queenslandica TaxID=400682 RepID=A0A1X7U296_AMPQE